jgi:hypothetical protein
MDLNQLFIINDLGYTMSKFPKSKLRRCSILKKDIVSISKDLRETNRLLKSKAFKSEFSPAERADIRDGYYGTKEYLRDIKAELKVLKKA